MYEPLNIYAQVVSAAKANMHFEDFKIDGRMSGNIRQGYEARMSAFQQLADQGFVKLHDSRLTLGSLTEKSWLREALLFGDLSAWEICDAFPRRAKKFEPDNVLNAEIGLEGELYVFNWLSENLTNEKVAWIDHVSLRDDAAGFDISSPTRHFSENVALEIKTSTRISDAFTFYLSRNEWEVSQRMSNWFLVLVQKNRGKHGIFGYLDGRSLSSYFPTDSHPNFEWTVSKGQLTQDDIFQTMPGF